MHYHQDKDRFATAIVLIPTVPFWRPSKENICSLSTPSPTASSAV